jgi:membrane associated rhomboid family serine protease
VFGDNIEDALGHVKFAAFYLACAALSGLVYILFAMGTYTWLIGASGAVAGVMGAYIVLYPHARVYVLLGLTIPIPLPLPALWMLGAWAAVQLFYLVFGDASPVAWSAHVGGLIAGAALCVPLKRRDVALFGGR